MTREKTYALPRDGDEPQALRVAEAGERYQDKLRAVYAYARGRGTAKPHE